MSIGPYDLFGDPPASILAGLSNLVPNFEGTRYQFMPLLEFQDICVRDPATANRIYWSEILARAHFAAASSIARGLSWIAGAQAAAISPNLLMFAACLRGFTESAADSYQALSRSWTAPGYDAPELLNVLKKYDHQSSPKGEVCEISRLIGIPGGKMADTAGQGIANGAEDVDLRLQLRS